MSIARHRPASARPGDSGAGRTQRHRCRAVDESVHSHAVHWSARNRAEYPVPGPGTATHLPPRGSRTTRQVAPADVVGAGRYRREYAARLPAGRQRCRPHFLLRFPRQPVGVAGPGTRCRCLWPFANPTRTANCWPRWNSRWRIGRSPSSTRRNIFRRQDARRPAGCCRMRPGLLIPPTLQRLAFGAAGHCRRQDSRLPDNLPNATTRSSCALSARMPGAISTRSRMPKNSPPISPRWTDAEFFISRFIDYSGKDGLFRKFRVALIDGKPYACHMGVSSNWMIHYVNAGMYEDAAEAGRGSGLHGALRATLRNATATRWMRSISAPSSTTSASTARKPETANC